MVFKVFEMLYCTKKINQGKIPIFVYTQKKLNVCDLKFSDVTKILRTNFAFNNILQLIFWLRYRVSRLKLLDSLKRNLIVVYCLNHLNVLYNLCKDIFYKTS